MTSEYPAVEYDAEGMEVEVEKPVMPELGLQDLRTVATDFASRAPHGSIFELLINADKVLAYLKNGTLPDDGPTDSESL